MAKKEPLTFLEQIVWDALKQSRCPRGHRYKGPAASLPCRWCRTAHAVMLTLKRMIAEKVSPEDMLKEFERLVGWTFDAPVVGEKPKFEG